MAIELHHLNTHDLFRDATKMIDGVVRLKERIAELEKENQTLAEDVSDKIESITELMELVEKYKSEKAELEEERRWREFPDEKPTEDTKFLVINEKGFIQCCYYSPILHEFQIPVTHWMPLPSDPKEEK